ncbi:alkaline phosphatase family protein [Rhodoblastus acidophilus]|uniref:Alkaline phosphatase family protein n=1 Tax=Candidatus Rhodoblastus alkanivorans TaxID=2954117 RepID=A0ABS9Z9Y3_9HYPH|nr:alkaline phosphatase family protein [Candidatus Rhodoblastus alkanivorans]MCI4684504.1 alkaline phosphatase family protein [Candidatus Rhodoblastus alkanivorans]MDI4641825.1 alkaline phosphatase family protein [Rhodoblastus acidophilus]
MANSKSLANLLASTAVASSLAIPFATLSPAAARQDRDKHVLILSIDGFHQADLNYFVAHRTCPNIAALVKSGVTYTSASTTKPSDSFLGTIAQVSGATPKSAGVFYDDSYDRTLYSPNCASGPGAETTFAENVDTDSSRIDGGVPNSLLSANGAVAISAAHLPGKMVNGKCQPVWPHNFLRVNTIFSILHARGYRTAWSDKHPAYDILNGPDAFTLNGPGRNIDDFFAPEIDSDLSAANIALVASLGLKSTAPNPTPIAGGSFTSSIGGVECYDGLKVQAILNEIAGRDHTGMKKVGVPAVFGLNFQSVSVGQKLKGNGYSDPQATPSAGLQSAITFADNSIGQMVETLARNNLDRNTTIIVSAKHGQSPIDVSKRVTLKDSTVIAGPPGSNYAFDMADDVTLIWLKDNSGTKTADAVKALNAYGDTGIMEWLSGPLLASNYQDPQKDSRTPDIIGVTRVGVIYTGGSKLAEHGGFNEDDTHVALIVSNPQLIHASINAPVETTQIAPTVLKLFGLDPDELDGVKLEGTTPLPGLQFRWN